MPNLLLNEHVVEGQHQTVSRQLIKAMDDI